MNLKSFQGFFADGGNWYTTVRAKQRHFFGTFVAMIFTQKSKFVPPGSKITFCSKRPDIVPNVTWNYPYIHDLTYVLDKLKESKIFEMSQNLLWYIFEVIWVGQSYGTLMYIFLFDGKKSLQLGEKKNPKLISCTPHFLNGKTLHFPYFKRNNNIIQLRNRIRVQLSQHQPKPFIARKEAKQSCHNTGKQTFFQ